MPRRPDREGRGPAWLWLVGAAFTAVNLVLMWGVPALFQVDPIGAYFRHTVDSLFNLLVPRQGRAADRRGRVIPGH